MRDGFLNRFCNAAAVVLFIALSVQPAQAQESQTPVTSEQLFLMLFVDQGRTIGYQRMLAGIQLDTVRAELERDAAILERNRELYEKNAIRRIELEIAQLKDAWNRKQLIVAEKSAETIGAQFSAITRIARSFAGEPIPVGELFAAYRQSWEAGCDKGPDEVAAMAAWVAYAETSLARARQLHGRGSLPLSTLLERETQVKIARANHNARAARLDRCRAVLFPSLEDITAVGE
jgi:hypothetical protein